MRKHLHFANLFGEIWLYECFVWDTCQWSDGNWHLCYVSDSLTPTLFSNATEELYDKKGTLSLISKKTKKIVELKNKCFHNVYWDYSKVEVTLQLGMMKINNKLSSKE